MTALGLLIAGGVQQLNDFYNWLLLVAAGLWFVGALVYSNIEEFPGETDGGASGLGEALGKLSILRTDREFRRFVIARALLMDAPLLLLDEATSALDSESEALIKDAVARLMKDRTVLAIAHRLSTVRSADEILVISRGAVVERGPHSALMATDGAYRRLVSRQIQG